ncbi:MAG: 2-hydroxyacid dehydrogenase [Burkholderiales bacterium]|nr:2-hydroxyacid dehydrogenase [Burkholderiales bacterium]
MRIVFRFDGSAALRERVAAVGVELCAESDDAAFDRLLPDVEVLWHVLKPVSAEVIARAPRLKLVQKIGSGVNTIDLDACRARGIAVCNLPGANAPAVAEMTLLLILACLRRLRELDAAVRRPGGWREAWQLQDRFGEIGGRTVGLVGYGAVARRLRPALEALGARVLWWSRSAASADLDTVIARSDIVSLHLPLVPETGHRIDPWRMKPGAILVNTARGGLVDEARLVEALRAGHLAAAGLDVFAHEPLAPDHPLLGLPNVVVSPHLAWLTPETIERSLAPALENVRRLEAGLPLLHRVA